MKLATRLYLTFCLLFGLIVAHLWIVGWEHEQNEAVLRAHQSVQLRERELLDAVSRAVAELERLLEDSAGDLPELRTNHLDRARAPRDVLRSAAAGLPRLEPATTRFAAAHGEFEKRWAHYARLENGAEIAASRQRDLLPFFHLEFRPAAAALDRAATQAAANDQAARNARHDTLSRRYRVSVVVFITILVAIGFYWHRLLIRPLRRMESDAQALRAGLRSDIRHTYRGTSELDALGDAVNTALDAIRANSLTRDELERLVAQRSAELHTSAQRLDLALDASATCIWDCDLAGDRILLDARWTALTGHPESTSVHTARSLLALVHPDDKSEVMRALRRCTHAGEDAYTVEHRVRHADGNWLWLLSHGRVIERNSAGQATRMIGTNTDISARREAERALSQSRTRLEHLLANAPVTLHCSEATPPHRSRFISPNIEDLLGFPAHAFVQQPGLWAERLHADDRERVLAALDAVPASGSLTHEYRFRHRDGSWRWLLDTLRLATNPVDGSREIVGHCTDISARREAEQALRQSRARLEFLLHQSAAIIYTCHASGDFGATFVSANVSPALGYTPEEFTTDTGFWVQRLHPDDAPRVLAELPALFKHNTHSHEYRFRHRDGAYRWIRDELRLIRDPAGEPLEIVGSMLDITDRKQAEAAAHAQREQTLLFQSTLLALRDHEGDAPPQFFRVATEAIARALGVERAGIWLFDETRTALVCADLYQVGPGEHTSGVRLAAADYPIYFAAAAAQLEPVLAHDARTHPITGELSARYLEPLGIASVLDVPIRVGGQWAGALCCEHIGSCRSWTTEESKFAVAAASYLMLALEQAERRRAEAEVAQQLQFFATLNQTAVDLLSHHDRGELLHAIVQRSAALLAAPHAELALLEGDELVIAARANAPRLDSGERVSRTEAPLSWQAVDTREPVVLADYSAPSNPRAHLPPSGLRATAILPIVRGPHCLGVLVLLRTESDHPFTRTEIAEARLFTQLAALVLHQASIYDDAVRLADARTTELRQREALYRSLVESINEGYYIADARGRLTYASPALEAMGGFSPGELLGRSSFRVVADEDQQRVVDLYRAWRADPAVLDVRCEFRVVAKTGRKFWVEQSTHFERDAASRVTEGRNVIRDISERKAAEAAMRESEERFRGVFDNSPVIVGLLSLPEGRIIEINRAAEQAFGVAQADARGRTSVELGIWANSADRDRYLALLRQHGKVESFETQMRRHDGTTFTVLYSGTIITIDGRKYSLNTLLDITDRKATEAALQKSEARFRLIWEKSLDGMRLTDGDGRVVAVNDAFCRLVGRDRSALEGQPFSDIYAPADRERILSKHRDRFARRDVPSLIEQSRELWDGRTITLEVSNCFVEADDRPLLMGIFRDVTARRSAELAVRASEERFQLVNRAVFNVIWDQDLTSEAIWWSEQFTTVYGHDRAAASAGDFWRAHLHPEDRARVVAGVKTALAGASDVWSDEYRFRRADGTYAHVEDRAHIVRNPAGRPLRLIGAMQDVSERRRAELAVRESEARFRGVFDRSPIPIVLATLPEGRIIEANAAAERTFGFSRHEFAGATTVDLGVWTEPTQRSQFIALLREKRSVTGFEVRLRRRDGFVLDFLFSGTLIELDGREHSVISLLDITDRKVAETALRDSEERYRALTEFSGDAIMLIDAQGRIRSANPAAERMHGYSLAELLELDIQRLDTPGSSRLAPERFQRLFAGETLTFEVEHFRKDGSSFPLEVIAKMVTVGGDSFILSSQRDITQRRRIEAESQRLAILARETKMAVLITDPTGKIEWTNEGFTALSGYTLDEVRGRRPGSILQGPGTDPATRRLIREKIAAQEPIDTEILNYSKQGDSYWVHLTLQPMRDATDNLVGFFATSFDVTDRRLTSEALSFLSVQTAAMAGSAYFSEVARFLATFLAVDAGFVCGYLPGDRSRFHTHSHWRDDIAPSSNPGEIYHIAQKACAKLAGATFFHVAEGAAALFPEDPLLRDRGISGYAAVEIRDAHGQAVGFLGIMHRGPLHQPQRLESLLGLFAVRVAGEMARQQTEHRLRQAQKLESLGTLAGGIAHDFNNILTGMLGFVELTRFELPPDHRALPWIDGIGASGLRAKDLVRQILTFSRAGEGTLTSIQLQPVVREAVKLLRSSLPAMVRLDDTVAPDCPPVLADATQIHQVVMNLCTNAWHALPPEGGLIQVKLAPHAVTPGQATANPELKPGPYVLLSVEDNGCGMAPEVAERVFEPFFTTKEAGRGTGLGLAVVHGVVRTHGGTIAIRSNPGVGTVFELLFPAHVKISAPTSATARPARPVGGHERILFVDDDNHARKPLAMLLSRLGYQVEDVDHPVEALNRFSHRPDAYDLVITDFAMPALSGASFTRRLRALRADLPVIMISGFLDAERKQEFEECGASLFLRKPVDFGELADAVRRILTRAAGPNGRS